VFDCGKKENFVEKKQYELKKNRKRREQSQIADKSLATIWGYNSQKCVINYSLPFWSPWSTVSNNLNNKFFWGCTANKWPNF